MEQIFFVNLIAFFGTIFLNFSWYTAVKRNHLKVTDKNPIFLKKKATQFNTV